MFGSSGNGVVSRALRAVHRRVAPSPVSSRHMEYSMLYSEDDSISRPNARLLDLSIEAIIHAQRQTCLTDVDERLGGRFPFPDNIVSLWPGEHYKLLAGLVQVLKPALVLEIGTAEGLSALSMLKYLPSGGRIVTFDIVPWVEYPKSCLTPEDFKDGRLSQIIADLGDRKVFESHQALLAQADLVFIDAAKDGTLEQKLVANFESLRYESKPIFVFDDIRLWNMLSVWRELRWPKLDLTSFGHWCGTGICEPEG
jgi:predicted O-methyltransferase YrrM